MSNELSRLEPVELRSEWTHEANEFTPWLARDENLELLGETLGFELELGGQEVNVGPFKADILCKNTVDNTWVVIENQLEKTDHWHLGQILTYSAGLNAKTIIWIASEFQDEHRAALDKLNEITQEEYQFFGIEIKLWKIGDSQAAPQFEIVANPNDWQRTITKNTQRIIKGELSETQLQLERYWSGLHDYMVQNNSDVKCPKPGPWRFLRHNIGRTGFNPESYIGTTKKEIGIRLYINSENTLEHFRMLEEQQDAIENEFQETLEWDELPGSKSCRISIHKSNTDPLDETDWINQYKWFTSKLESFNQVFRPRIKALNVADWNNNDKD